MPLDLWEAPAQQVRKWAAALGVKQGDQSQHELLQAVKKFTDRILATMRTIEEWARHYMCEYSVCEADAIDTLTREVNYPASRGTETSGRVAPSIRSISAAKKRILKRKASSSHGSGKRTRR